MNIKSKLLVIFTLVLSANVNAAIVQFQFTGIVDLLDSSLTGEFNLGESVIGSYKVDDTNFSATDLVITIGGDYVLTANTGYVSVAPGTWFVVSFNSDLTGNPVSGFSPYYFDIQLDDPNTLLQTGVLPLNYPIGDFGNDRSNINFLDSSNRLDFSVTSISAVPVPAAMWLFGSGLLGLIGVARRKVQA